MAALIDARVNRSCPKGNGTGRKSNWQQVSDIDVIRFIVRMLSAARPSLRGRFVSAVFCAAFARSQFLKAVLTHAES